MLHCARYEVHTITFTLYLMHTINRHTLNSRVMEHAYEVNTHQLIKVLNINIILYIYDQLNTVSLDEYLLSEKDTL